MRIKITRNLHITRETQTKNINKIKIPVHIPIDRDKRLYDALNKWVDDFAVATGVPRDYLKGDVDPEHFKRAMYASLVLEGYIPKKN